MIIEIRKRLDQMQVSRFQAKAALHLAGLLDTVESAMTNADQVARIAWQDALLFRRQSPTVLAIAESLDLTSAQLDQLFIVASGIEA